MDEHVLITGGTGVIGHEIISHFIREGVCIRIGIRNMQKLKEMERTKCPVVYFDYEKPETFKEAFHGVTSLFLSTPVSHPGIGELMLPALKYAQESGIRKVVCLGSVGSEISNDSPLSIAEKMVQCCGIEYVILRPNLIMQNFITLAGEPIRRTGSIHAPAGDARISFVDARDIAEAAYSVLIDNRYNNNTYFLTGRQALSLLETASILSSVTGKRITYIPISHNQADEELKAAGFDERTIDLIIGLYEIARRGWCSEIKPDLSDILKRPQRTFEQFANDNRDVWL